MKIRLSNIFKKDFKKLSSENKRKVDNALELFLENPFNVKLRNHSLTGNLKNLRSISAGYNLRLVYREEKEHLIVIFIHVGGHEIYKK